MRLVVLAVTLTCTLGLSGCGSGDTPVPTPPAPPEVAPVELAELLPASLLGHERESLDASRDSALGAEIAEVQARYGEAALSITDFATTEMADMMGHGWANAPGAETILGHPGQRETAASSATVRIVVNGRFLVEATATSEQDAMAALETVDLTALG